MPWCTVCDQKYQYFGGECKHCSEIRVDRVRDELKQKEHARELEREEIRAAQRDHDLKIAKEITTRETESGKTTREREKTAQEKQQTTRKIRIKTIERETETEKTTQDKEKTAQEKQQTAREIRNKTIERDIEREKTTQEKQRTAQKQHDAKITSETEHTAQLKMYLELIENGVPSDVVTEIIQQKYTNATSQSHVTSQSHATSQSEMKKAKARKGKQNLHDMKGT